MNHEAQKDLDAMLIRFADAVSLEPMTMRDRVLNTLEVNKIEVRYQDYDKPRIFLKELDEFGLVLSVAVNPSYDDTIPLPKSEFTRDERREISRLLRKIDPAFIVFLLTCQMEKVIFATVAEVTLADITPPLKKKFNERGFPSTYQLNWPVEHVYPSQS